MLAGPDLLVIMAIALIVFGPKKLPEIGQTIGKAMREFKKASEDIRESFEGEIKEMEEKRENDLTRTKPSADPTGEATKSLALPEAPSPEKELAFQKAAPPVASNGNG